MICNNAPCNTAGSIYVAKTYREHAVERGFFAQIFVCIFFYSWYPNYELYQLFQQVRPMMDYLQCVQSNINPDLAKYIQAVSPSLTD